MSGPAAHVASPSIQFPLKFMSALGEGPYTAGIVVWFCHNAQCENLQLMNVKFLKVIEQEILDEGKGTKPRGIFTLLSEYCSVIAFTCSLFYWGSPLLFYFFLKNSYPSIGFISEVFCLLMASKLELIMMGSQ